MGFFISRFCLVYSLSLLITEENDFLNFSFPCFCYIFVILLYQELPGIQD